MTSTSASGVLTFLVAFGAQAIEITGARGGLASARLRGAARVRGAGQPITAGRVASGSNLKQNENY